mgnify:CR=1 FL=1
MKSKIIGAGYNYWLKEEGHTVICTSIFKIDGDDRTIYLLITYKENENKEG